MEEPMHWGRNAGCSFPPSTCTADTLTKYPDTFCNTNDVRQRCASGRAHVGTCATLTGTSLTGCAVVSQTHTCERESEANLGSLTGSGSWCLDADALMVAGSGNPVEVAGVCAKVKCDDGKVQVQYRGSEAWHDCPEGSTITPSSTSFSSGSIKCPKYAEVCTIADDGSSLVTPPSASNGAAAASRLGPLALLLAAAVLLV